MYAIKVWTKAYDDLKHCRRQEYLFVTAVLFDMRLPPDDVILSWTPNYIDPVTRGSSLIIVNAIFIFLVIVAVVGRLYSRIFVKKWFGLDDAMIVPAFVSSATCRYGLQLISEDLYPRIDRCSDTGR